MRKRPQTETQRRSIELLAEGKSVAEVADELGIAERTVRAHRTQFAGNLIEQLEPSIARIKRATPEMLATLEAASRQRDAKGHPTPTAVRAASIYVEQGRRHDELAAKAPSAAGGAQVLVIEYDPSREQIARTERAEVLIALEVIGGFTEAASWLRKFFDQETLQETPALPEGTEA